MQKQEEIWKDIPNYEGLYQASNLGRIKSLARFVNSKANSKRFKKEKILKGTIRQEGYLTVGLRKRTIDVHKLIAICFLNHTPCGYELVVDHINLNKLDNRAENLRIITQRKNSNLKHIKSTSKYTGVSWNNKNKNWISYISIKKKMIYLGSFDSEEEASLFYENAVKSIESKTPIMVKRFISKKDFVVKEYIFKNTKNGK